MPAMPAVVVEVVPRVALSVPEAAEAMSVSERTIRIWIADGVLARVPHTQRTLIAVSELRRFADGGAA